MWMHQTYKTYIHAQVSAVHSVSGAVSVVFVSEGFTNTNVV